MLQIRDVMTRHVFTVTPETTLREAADLFARHHISGAPVLAGHSIVGVVSATDLLEFVASHDGVRSPNDDRPAIESGERMLVLERGHLAGILSTSDVARAVARQDVSVPRGGGDPAWRSS